MGRTNVSPEVGTLVAVVLVGAVLLAGVAVTADSGVVLGNVQGFDDHPDSENQTDPGIEHIEIWGDGYIEEQDEIVADHPGTPFVWQSEPVNFTVEVSPETNASGPYELCGVVHYEDEDETFDCESVSTDGGTDEVALTLSTWSENATERHTVDIILIQGETVQTEHVELYVIRKDGDLTGDGLTNEEEVTHGTDFTRVDTSGSGLTDWEEVKKYGTNPHLADTTGDGIKDGTVASLGLDPTTPYIVHIYALGLLTFLLVAIGIVFHVMQRVFGPTTPTVEDEPTPAPPDDLTPVKTEHASASSAEAPDETLMTNTEQVCRLVEQNGGRLKQKKLVTETGWSKAKVSRTLSDLEDEGRIEKLRVGRENIIELVDRPTVEHDGKTGD